MMTGKYSPDSCRGRRYRRTFSALLAALLLGSLLCGCTARGKDAESTDNAAKSTDTAAGESAAETSPAEYSVETVSPENTRIEPGDANAAYRSYVSVLEEALEGLPEGAGKAGGPSVVTAICDIVSDSAPELFYLTQGFEGENPCLHIVTNGADGPEEILKDENLCFREEYDGRYCFFTLSGDRTLYEFSSLDEGERNAAWYYYHLTGDGVLEREELCAARSQNTAFFYRGQEIPEESYRELTDTLLGRMENILFVSSEGIFEDELYGSSDFAEEYSMNADQAVRFMRSLLSEAPGEGSFSEILADFIGEERYLMNGEAQYLEEEEIRIGLYDMNADGVPELFVTNGSASFTNRFVHVYGFEDDAFHYLDDAGFRECLLYTAPGSGYPGVFCQGGDSGFIMEYYYTLEEDGSIKSELVASFEDTSFKVESHDDQVVTQDEKLYEAWLQAWPREDNPGHYLPMFTSEELENSGVELLLESAGITE